MAIWYAHLDEDQVMAAIHRPPAETSKPNKGKKAKKETKAAKLAEKHRREDGREDRRQGPHL